jgi:Thrombospondin type 1 domain
MQRCNETAPIAGSAAALVTQQCNLQPCATFEAVAGPWQACSVTCGGGTQTRSATCMQNGVYPVQDALCPDTPPLTQARLRTQPSRDNLG